MTVELSREMKKKMEERVQNLLHFMDATDWTRDEVIALAHYKNGTGGQKKCSERLTREKTMSAKSALLHRQTKLPYGTDTTIPRWLMPVKMPSQFALLAHGLAPAPLCERQANTGVVVVTNIG